VIAGPELWALGVVVLTLTIVYGFSATPVMGLVDRTREIQEADTEARLR